MTPAREDRGLAEGINVELKKVTNKPVAECFGLEFTPSSVAK